MNRTLALGVAVAALAGVGAAFAQPAHPTEQHRVVIMHGGPAGADDMDTNHDGWLSRAEASAAADRIFDQLDSNHDGRLTPDDHAHDRMVRHAGMESDDQNCETTVEPPREGQTQGREERRVTVICRDGDDDAHTAPQAHEEGQRIERNVTVIMHDDGDDDGAAPAPPVPPAPPAPPAPPHPPMFMMMLANSDEADTNHDGALSREEFRAQQLRFFDAGDANGDGRIRFEPPPEPPVAPEPPTPPQPPAPRHH